MKIILFISSILVMLLQTGIFARDYNGAELRTIDTYTYGRVEAHYKPARGNGILSTLFTYHETQYSSEWNEIDIEILGRYRDNVQFTTITGGPIYHPSHQWVNFDPHADFHTYAFEWTPEYVAWFIDGVEIYRQTGSHVTTLNRGQKIMMNMWISSGKDWVGEWDDRILPKFAYYDWVSYSSYSPGAGDSGTDNNFKFEWKDNFDSLNTERWEKATHTFSGNLCDFTPENIVFQDGMMILCLTDNDNVGYTDINPPAVLWVRAEENKFIVRFSEAIEQNSAEKVSNYVKDGVTISQAVLLPDNRTVRLDATGIPESGDIYLLIRDINDLASTSNVLSAQLVKVFRSKPFIFPLRINVGGNSLGNYLSDQVWGPEAEYGHVSGHEIHRSDTIEIANTLEDSIYRDELRDLVIYKIHVPNGTYRCTLKFAENRYQEIGKRVFNIISEGKIVAEKLDLVKLATPHAAYDLITDPIQVSDGILDIHFTNLIEFAILNGLVIEQLSTSLGENSQIDAPGFRLYQNYPNPFNPVTSINYSIQSKNLVRLEVFNLLGQKVATLVDQLQTPGDYTLNFNASHLASGIYFYSLGVGDHIQNRKMVLMK